MEPPQCAALCRDNGDAAPRPSAGPGPEGRACDEAAAARAEGHADRVTAEVREMMASYITL